ncbi:MAG: putative ABC transporter permease [Clostridiales bacterium]|nr:putative ABC transporter permease [Clostridiales bacterium]
MISIKVKSRSVDLTDLASWFFIYSFFGWIYETIYCSLTEGHYVNRGFLYGPIIPIYGSCIVFAIVLLYEKKINKIALFGICAFIASAFEYVTSWWMELIFNRRWWDYSNELFNINGRVCLGAALVFGLFGVLILCYFHPFLEKFLNECVPPRLTKALLKIFMPLFTIDLLASIISA